MYSSAMSSQLTSETGAAAVSLTRRGRPAARPAVGRAPLGRARGALRRALPRRPRRVDGRRGAPLDRRRSRPLDVVAAVGRLGLRARLRRAAAARRALRRPARAPARAARRARRVHGRVDRRRARRRRHAARHHPLPQGRGRSLHGAGQPLDHHDDLRRRAGAQPGARDLHRLRGQRLLARARLRRAPDRARLALDVPAAGADRDRAPDRGTARPRRRTSPRRARGAASTSPAPRRSRQRCCCSSAPSSRRPEAGWGSRRDGRRPRLAALLLAAFVAIEQRSAHPLVRLGILRSGTLVRANLGMAAVFGAYVAFQFVGTLYLQHDARLVAGRDGARVPARRPAGRVRSAAHRPARRPLRHRQDHPRRARSRSSIGYALFLRIGESLTYADRVPAEHDPRSGSASRSASRRSTSRPPPALPTTSRDWPRGSSTPRSRWAARSGSRSSRRS